MQLNIKALGLAFGIVWGVGLFALTWWIILLNGSTGEVPFIRQVYRGFAISPVGSLFGLVWGFADGFVGGVIFAWLYNRFAR